MHSPSIRPSLIMAQGHTAHQVCDLSVALLSCFGVRADTDLFGTVNDNTNSAVLAGKYILNHQGEGKYNMHITDIILKHVTGLVIHTKNRVMVDSNPSFIAIYNKFREFTNWLMNKIAKGTTMTSKQKVKRMAKMYEKFHYPTRHGWLVHSSCFKYCYETSGQWMSIRISLVLTTHLSKNIHHKTNGSNWQNLRLSSCLFKNVPFRYKPMTPPPIPGHFWKYILPNVKLKECNPPMQWSCP